MIEIDVYEQSYNVFHHRAGHTTEPATPSETRQLIYPLLLQPPTMPPIRSQSSKNLVEQEVARRFNIPRSTLQDRLRGHQQRANSRANSSKLTEIEEESLKKWVLSMDLYRVAPRPSIVREMADLLL
ncbi:Helix-turn-helix, Psq [Penicillium camemberti]|uniref:Helix-turn-helix, Psq n=1 Tax=Penicillium camemberti (strain FM 013) TaxID=1429867 RepID=A0A0G4PU25_PENC3|nr:Helix-turn-helix, Psq [Penicillium camemberti]